MQRFAAVAVFVFLLHCVMAPARAADEGTDGARAAVALFAENWNKHDMDALAAQFSPDGDFIQINGIVWKGRQQIQQNLAFLHGTVPKDSVSVTIPQNTYGVFKASTYQFDRVELRLVGPGVAVAHIEWTQLNDPRFAQPRKGILTLVATKEREHWLLNSAQNTLR